ncbi:MAG: DUF5991 domain-containing protein [Bacteroidota bacterium]
MTKYILIISFLIILSCKKNSNDNKESDYPILADNEGMLKEPEINQISNFLGKYDLLQDKGRLDEFSSMIISYTIEVKKDSIFFSGQGYKTNFRDLCSSKVDGDTLKLYYKLTIEGDEYNKVVDESLVRLYKKNNEFYVKSPVITSTTWEENVEIKIEKIE